MDSTINYSFQIHEKYFTLKKNYSILLEKDKESICVTRQYAKTLTENAEKNFMDYGERFSGKVTTEGVEIQLANVKQVVFEAHFTF